MLQEPPLVRVARRNEIFTLTGYQPPSLALTRDSPLGRACTELIGTIRQKAVKLTHRVNAPSLPSDSAVRRQMLERLDSLVAALPPFEAVVKSGVAHPFMVYLALTALVGHVTRLGAGEVPPVLEAYDHDDPQSSFEPAFAFLDRMLARIQETFTALPFHYDEGRFWIHLDPAYMAPALTIGVRAPTGWDDRDVVAWARDCLISTESGMDAVQDYRIRGAAREQIDRDTELGLDPPNGVVLFRVTADPEYVRPDRQLVIWDWHDDPGRPRPAEILLYVRTGTAKADRPAPAGQGAGT